MEAFLTVCPASEEGKLNWTDFESILRRQTGEQLQSDEISVIQKAMASLKVDKKKEYRIHITNPFINSKMITLWLWTIS